MTAPDVLELHGTTIGGLTASAVVTAAEYDMRRKERNKGNTSGACEHYAFHRKHVKKATSAADLITRALAERGIGAASGKRGTRLIYKDEVLLTSALERAMSTPLDMPSAEAHIPTVDEALGLGAKGDTPDEDR